jgi:cytochrome c peroxidase
LFPPRQEIISSPDFGTHLTFLQCLYELIWDATIALFKTPTVRDLASSEPYRHTGQLNTIEDVINFYQDVSMEARAGTLRNANPQLRFLSLDDPATAPLAAFLRSLNEAAYVDIPCPCASGIPP